MPRRVKNGWLAEWRVGYGRGAPRASKVLPTKAAAAAYEEQQREAQRRGEYVNPKTGRTPFRDVAAELLAGVDDTNTADSYRHRLNAHILPHLGDAPIADITEAHLDDLAKRLNRKGLAPSTRRGVLLMALMVIRHAERRRQRPPFPRYPLPEVRRNPLVIITRDQARALLDGAPAHGRAAVALGLGCGLRQGEVLGLAEAQVDFLRRRVDVQWQLDPQSSGARKPPKTDASQTTVPLPSWVADELAVHMQQWPVDDGGPILRTLQGRVWRRQSFNASIWAPAREAAGLPATRPYGFHITRHFFVSALIDMGLNPLEVQRLARHASITETMDTYGHLFPDAEDRARRALNGFWDEQGTNGERRAGP